MNDSPSLEAKRRGDQFSRPMLPLVLSESSLLLGWYLVILGLGLLSIGTGLALAAAGGILLAVRRPVRERLGLGLVTLLFVLAAGVGLGWFIHEAQRVIVERDAVEEIRRMGGSVGCFGSGSNPGDPVTLHSRLEHYAAFDEWLREFLQVEHYHYPANEVDLRGAGITDADLTTLKSLPHLELLSLDNTRITDAGLAHLAGLDRLLSLTLSGTQVTDAGLAHLKHLGRLELLDLGGTQVTAEGLDALQAALPRATVVVSSLRISGTVKKLHGTIQVDTDSPTRPVISVSLSFRGGFMLADADLLCLKGLASLRTLSLAGQVYVTDAGLEHLRGLTSLKALDLRGTRVTDEGIKTLQQALPDCTIRH